MSDRSAFTLVIYDCPDTQEQRQIAQIASREGLSEYYSGTVPDGASLVFGEAVGYHEMSMEAYRELGQEIAEKAPGATFECWNDPKYEYSGMLFMYAPGLGAFIHASQEDGSLSFAADEVDRALEMQPDERAKFLGKPWLERMKVKEIA